MRLCSDFQHHADTPFQNLRRWRDQYIFYLKTFTLALLCLKRQIYVLSVNLNYPSMVRLPQYSLHVDSPLYYYYYYYYCK